MIYKLLIATVTLLLSLSLSTGSFPTTTRPEDVQFMDNISREEGVVVLPSGLIYKEIRSGRDDGMAPGHFEHCTMIYHSGTLTDKQTKPTKLNIPDGAVTIRMRPSELIPGWGEALQRMKEGALWEVYIPPVLGYRHMCEEVGVPGDAVFVLRFELLKVHRGVAMDEL